MSKKKTFFQILRHASDALHVLESSGIDVDRLIGISNAQGPQAKLIRELLSPDQVESLVDVEKSLGPRPKLLKSGSTGTKKAKRPS